MKATTRLGGYTPLLMAADQGHATVIAALLTGGADPKTPNALGTTPLMLAAASGNPQAVTILVENGAEIEAKEKTFGQTPLMFAAASNRVEAIKALIKAGASLKATSKVNNVGNLSGQEQEFPAWAPPWGSGNQAGGNGTGRKRTGHGSGVAAGAQGAQGAGAAGAPVTAPGGGGRRGGFGGAPGVERPYFYNELIDKQGGHTALILAARGGYTEAAKTLVAAGADVNHISAGDKTSAMLIATINGHFDLAKWLLDQGADPSAAASNGVTPLYAALNVTFAPRALYPQPRAYNQQQITYSIFMKALLEKGANPDLRLTKKVWYPTTSTSPASTRLAPRRSGARRLCRRCCRRWRCSSSTALTRTFRLCDRPAAGRSAMSARRGSWRTSPDPADSDRRSRRAAAASRRRCGLR